MGDAPLLLHHTGELVLIIITYYTHFADPQTADQMSLDANFLRPLVAASHLDATIPRPPQYTDIGERFRLHRRHPSLSATPVGVRNFARAHGGGGAPDIYT